MLSPINLNQNHRTQNACTGVLVVLLTADSCWEKKNRKITHSLTHLFALYVHSRSTLKRVVRCAAIDTLHKHDARISACVFNVVANNRAAFAVAIDLADLHHRRVGTHSCAATGLLAAKRTQASAPNDGEH